MAELLLREFDSAALAEDCRVKPGLLAEELRQSSGYLTMRNDSRVNIEDPDNHFTVVGEVAGAATTRRITQFDSTIVLQTVATAGTS